MPSPALLIARRNGTAYSSGSARPAELGDGLVQPLPRRHCRRVIRRGQHTRRAVLALRAVHERDRELRRRLLVLAVGLVHPAPARVRARSMSGERASCIPASRMWAALTAAARRTRSGCHVAALAQAVGNCEPETCMKPLTASLWTIAPLPYGDTSRTASCTPASTDRELSASWPRNQAIARWPRPCGRSAASFPGSTTGLRASLGCAARSNRFMTFIQVSCATFCSSDSRDASFPILSSLNEVGGAANTGRRSRLSQPERHRSLSPEAGTN